MKAKKKRWKASTGLSIMVLYLYLYILYRQAGWQALLPSEFLLCEVHVANVFHVNGGRVKVVDQVREPFLEQTGDVQVKNGSIQARKSYFLL